MKSIILYITDLPQAIHFYVQQLGFQLLQQTHHEAHLQFEQQLLTLTVGRSHKQRVTFQTSAIDSLEKRVLQEKIKFVRPPYTRDEETETFNKVFDEWIIEDPEGHELTFSSFVHFRC
jgi:catechol 2,3-dioxygenase-like lactoylglutathione lyase family enzyme